MTHLKHSSVLTFHLFAFLFCNLVSAQNVHISEFLASNGNYGLDEDGDHSDWIEIHNAGEQAVNLGGWFLSDDTGDLLKWELGPGVVIEAGEFLLVWASGKNRNGSGSELHSSFRLDSSGEVVVFTDDSGRIVDLHWYEALPRDVSAGVRSENESDLVYYKTPTPGAPNDDDFFAGIVDPPEFSHVGGIYPASFELEVFGMHADDEILFTLDGSNPGSKIGVSGEYNFKNSYPHRKEDPNGPLLTHQLLTYGFNGPLLIENNPVRRFFLQEHASVYESHPGILWQPPMNYTERDNLRGITVRAKAVRPGFIESEVVSQTYWIHDDSIPLTSSLPILSTVVSPEALFGYENGIYTPGIDFDLWRAMNLQSEADIDWIRPANYRRQGMENEIPVDVQIVENGLPVLDQKLGMRIHGGDSRAQPQKSFRLYSRNRYDASDLMDISYLEEKTHQPVYPFDQRIQGRDPSVLLFQASNKHQDVVSHALLAPLNISVQRTQGLHHFFNGEYWGLTFMRDYQNEDYFSDLFHLSEDNIIILNAPYGVIDANFVESGRAEDIEDYNRLYELVTTGGIENKAVYEQALRYIDIESYIDYNIAFIYLNNPSWHGSAHFKWWKSRKSTNGRFGDERFRMAVWDFDHFIEDPAYDHLANAIHPTGEGNFGSVPERTLLLRSFLRNQNFRNQFVNRFATHIGLTFHPERFKSIVTTIFDQYENEMRPSKDRWPLMTFNEFGDPLKQKWNNFAEMRPALMRSHLSKNFDLGDEIVIQIKAPDENQGTVEVEGLDLSHVHFTQHGIGETVELVYFSGAPISITAKPTTGYEFSHWQGAEWVTESTLTIDPAELTSAIQPVFIQKEGFQVAHLWDFNVLNSPFVKKGVLSLGNLAIDASEDLQLAQVKSGLMSSQETFGHPANYTLELDSAAGSELDLTFTTDQLSQIGIELLASRSENGAEIIEVLFSDDRIHYQSAGKYFLGIHSAHWIRCDLSAFSELNNKAACYLKIRFEKGDGGSGGKNHIDNVQISGVLSKETNSIDALALDRFRLNLVEGKAHAFEVAELFRRSSTKGLEFEIQLIEDSRLEYDLDADVLELLPVAPGQEEVVMRVLDPLTGDSKSVLLDILINPKAHELSQSDYSFTKWEPFHSEGVFPDHMLFLQSDIKDPGLEDSASNAYHIDNADYHRDDQETVGFPYNNTRRTRINGLGDLGVSFVNTGRDRDLGGAVLAVDTTGCDNLELKWKCQVLSSASKKYGVRLRHRLNVDDQFEDLIIDGQIFEFRSDSGLSEKEFRIEIPDELNGLPYLQLEWFYYAIDTDPDGPRPEIRLDDISLKSGGGGILFPQSGSQMIAGENLFVLGLGEMNEGSIYISHNGKILSNAVDSEGFVWIDIHEGMNHLVFYEESETNGIGSVFEELIVYGVSEEDSEIGFFSSKNTVNKLSPLHQSHQLELNANKSPWVVTAGNATRADGPVDGVDTIRVDPVSGHILDMDSQVAAQIEFRNGKYSGSGAYLISAWLKAVDDNVVLRAETTGDFYDVHVTNNWERYSFLVQVDSEDNGFAVGTHPSESSGWMISDPVVYFQPESNVQYIPHLDPAFVSHFSAYQNGQHIGSYKVDGSVFSYDFINEKSGVMSFEMETAGGSKYVGSPVRFESLKAIELYPVDLFNGNVAVFGEVGRQVEIEVSDNFIDWLTILSWEKVQAEDVLNLQPFLLEREAQGSQFFRIKTQ